MTRRRLLAAGTLVPVMVVLAPALESLRSVVRRTLDGLRPASAGTSATRCALCGAPDHTMLDSRCPLAPRVFG